MLGGLYVLLFALGMFLLSDAIMDVFRGSETSFDTVPFHALGRTLMWLMLSWAAFDDGRVVVCDGKSCRASSCNGRVQMWYNLASLQLARRHGPPPMGRARIRNGPDTGRR